MCEKRIKIENEKEYIPQFLNPEKKEWLLSFLVQKSGIHIFEFFQKENRLVLYDENLKVIKIIESFMDYLNKDPLLHQDDVHKAVNFFLESCRDPVELRIMDSNGDFIRKRVDSSLFSGLPKGSGNILGIIKDITEEKEKQESLEEQAKRDPMTFLYNQTSGKKEINNYLMEKNPYASCGLMVIDIDYFKNVNDLYGHLFGDAVLVRLAQLLELFFDSKDILIRSGGDEFVVFMKEVSHSILVKKAMQLVKAVQQLYFEEHEYSMTCSIGVCFLPENDSGYTYDQLFENADWALYQAKKKGRNRCEFCDNLQRFHQWSPVGEDREHPYIDARYLRNDIVSSAFEIFEKTAEFDAAVETIMEVIGIRFQLHRITVIQTDIRGKTAGRQFQWVAQGASKVLEQKGQFEKEDFLTLFNSYDAYGTAVLHHDHMEMYSEDAVRLLMQGGAKTVVYCAMYCEGKYTGAISYVVCDKKRYWSMQQRKQLGEVTKILSAHLAKNRAMNASHQGIAFSPEYDSLTGLLSFSRFKEEVERIIVGNRAVSRLMIYIDFERFSYFNSRYGYSMGDQLLKSFANFVIEKLEDEIEVYFTRVVADQFIIFMPYSKGLAAAEKEIQKTNEEFIQAQLRRFPEVKLRLRIGLYMVDNNCISASAAIDAANAARKYISAGDRKMVQVFDEPFSRKKQMENEIINGMDAAICNEEFKLYLQPKFSIKDFSVIGAEALIRWERKDGTILSPDVFVPLYEKTGKIVELDFYVFRQVAKFLAENKKKARHQVPVSVNASILHAVDFNTANLFREILDEYGVDPGFIEIELTETDIIADYDHVIRFMKKLQDVRIRTALDDFGAGYSVFNTIMDIPVDTVKIDRMFINNCECSEKGIFLLKQVIQTMKGLGYHVVCEGVETERQVELLRDAGCDDGQGYWFSPPLILKEYEKLVYGE